MTPPPIPPGGEPVDWAEGGPLSPRFGDVYFSAVDGLRESCAVFLQGCDLPAGWAGRRRFVVGELGFGTGLNVLALLQLWAAHRPSRDARLSIVSIEGFPLAPADAARALGAWPELTALSGPLLDAWPRGRRGLHRIEWPVLGATLDLMVGEVGPSLEGWRGLADAWFLDGFAPAKNPQMWSAEIMALVAAGTAPGGRLATFTVAGQVRRDLEAGGLTVEKRPGFGRKRERLEARDPRPAAPEQPSPRVAVVGGGIAGAALVRALRRVGVEPVLLEGEGIGAGASGNDAALVTPRFDAGGGATARLHAEAFARAVALYDAETPQAVIARGALQLERTDADGARFARIATFDGFDPGSVVPLTSKAAAGLLDEADAPGGLRLHDGRVIEPSAVLTTWLAGADLRAVAVAALQATGAGWRLLDASGSTIAEVDTVILATGQALQRLAPGLTVRPVRGQASTAVTPFEGLPAAWGGYAIPTRNGVLFGASHVQGDDAVDIRPAEVSGNLARLAEARPALAARVEALPPNARHERASVRATFADHSPVAGALAETPGIFVLGGLGARGFTLAPLLAEHVAALATGAPTPLAHALARAVSPDRRSARRGSPEPPP